MSGQSILFVSVLFSILAASAANSDVVLTPGGSITTNGMKISCEGGANQSLPNCLVVQGQGGYYVLLGSIKIEGPVSYGSAMGTRANMVRAGQCK